MINPVSRNNLKSFPKGVNPHLLPNYKERGRGLKAKLRKAAELKTTDNVTGIELSYDEKIIIELLRRASGENETSEQGQLRAITEYFNRRHGKPVETQNLNLNGTLSISGRKVIELSAEERAAVRAKIETGEVYLLEDGTVRDAEYEEEVTDESGEFEAPVTIPPHTETM